MGLIGWISYVVVGILFFIFLTFVQNKYSITKMEKLVLSLILMVLVSGFYRSLSFNYTENIFLVFVFLLVVDVLYSSYFAEKDFFDKNEKNVSYYIVLIILAFFINNEFINKVNQVFLTGDDLRIVLWLLAIIFVYVFCQKKNVFNKVSVNNNSKYMSKETILINYAKLKYKYGDTYSSNNKDVNNLVYAIMVFENNRRGKILRDFDYLIFKLNGGKRKLGIMQIESNKLVTDKESIELVYKKIEKKKEKNKINIKDSLKNYKKEEIEYIEYIFDTIKKF